MHLINLNQKSGFYENRKLLFIEGKWWVVTEICRFYWELFFSSFHWGRKYEIVISMFNTEWEMRSVMALNKVFRIHKKWGHKVMKWFFFMRKGFVFTCNLDLIYSLQSYWSKHLEQIFIIYFHIYKFTETKKGLLFSWWFNFLKLGLMNFLFFFHLFISFLIS